MTEAQVNRLIGALKSTLGKIAASGGCKLVTGTDATSIEAKSIIVRENTVISALTGHDSTGTSQNFVTLFNISAATLIQGDLLVAPEGFTMTSITLSSGSVLTYS